MTVNTDALADLTPWRSASSRQISDTPIVPFCGYDNKINSLFGFLTMLKIFGTRFGVLTSKYEKYFGYWLATIGLIS